MERFANIVIPICGVALFPALMLVYPTESMIGILWVAAMLFVGTTAGQHVAPYMPRRVTILLLAIVVVGLVVVSWTGMLHFQREKLAQDLAVRAIIIVPISLFVAARIAQSRAEKRR